VSVLGDWSACHRAAVRIGDYLPLIITNLQCSTKKMESLIFLSLNYLPCLILQERTSLLTLDLLIVAHKVLLCLISHALDPSHRELRLLGHPAGSQRLLILI
jgi:hypothetical protein